MPQRIEWWKPRMGAREKELIGEVIDRNFPNDGPATELFQQNISKRLDGVHTLAVTNGTSALFLALAASGVKAGDEVLMPDLSFIAPANAVMLAGAVPVLVDVRRSDLSMDPEAFQKAITKRTKAVILVHVSGRPGFGDVLEIARKAGLKIIEDACEAFGSRWKTKALGTIGDAGCFSFTANKLITTGQGGAVVTKDASLFERLKELKDQGRRVRGTGGPDEHSAVGYNFKFTDVQAAMGLAQLEDFDKRCEHQRALYRFYEKALNGQNKIKLFGFDLEGGELPLWIDAWAEGRDALCEKLAGSGIETRKFWRPIHTQKPYQSSSAHFKNSVYLSENAFWLPSAFHLTEADVLRVANVIAGDKAKKPAFSS